MTWNRTTGATSRALRTAPVIVDGIPRHGVRIPAKPITHSEVMAITIPKCRSPSERSYAGPFLV
jgi:hypothetical protein